MKEGLFSRMHQDFGQLDEIFDGDLVAIEIGGEVRTGDANESDT